MSIICSICGGTHVTCAAIVGPNTRAFVDFGHEAFLDGMCEQYGNVVLTDPEELKADIGKMWADYIACHQIMTSYALCEIVRTDRDDGYEKAYIRIGGPENVIEKHKVITVCHNVEELKSLADPDPGRQFTVVGCLGLKSHEVMKNKTYEIEIEGRIISVTTKEVLDLYPEQYKLTEEDIRQYAAAYTARIKSYRECGQQLNATLVCRLLDEEHLMKPGESDSFKLQLHFPWFVRIYKERKAQYTMEAYCLDNVQTHSRRYTSLKEALLHCLNGFNENVKVPNRYQSIDEYLTKTIMQ